MTTKESGNRAIALEKRIFKAKEQKQLERLRKRREKYLRR